MHSNACMYNIHLIVLCDKPCAVIHSIPPTASAHHSFSHSPTTFSTIHNMASNSGIQTLLEAEKEASKIVAKAKQCKCRLTGKRPYLVCVCVGVGVSGWICLCSTTRRFISALSSALDLTTPPPPPYPLLLPLSLPPCPIFRRLYPHLLCLSPVFPPSPPLPSYHP